APDSPIVPTRIDRVEQPVKVQADDGSVAAGGRPMTPGIEGLAAQTSTFSAKVFSGCTSLKLGSLQTPPDAMLPVDVQETPSCGANIAQASHQLYFSVGRSGFCAPRIVAFRAPKNCSSLTAQATGSHEAWVQL